MSENARELYRLCLRDKLLTADVIEYVYSDSQYPGKLVVDNVVSLLRDDTSMNDIDEEFFVNYFATFGKTQNVEWYLMHILYTVTEIVPDKNFNSYRKIYEWWQY